MSLKKFFKKEAIPKGFIKQPVIKQSSTFLSFSFLVECCVSVFSLSLSKR